MSGLESVSAIVVDVVGKDRHALGRSSDRHSVQILGDVGRRLESAVMMNVVAIGNNVMRGLPDRES